MLNIFVCMLLITTAVIFASGKINIEDDIGNVNITQKNYDLPPPISVDMILEKSICRRMSIRTFTTESVTDEELSTILWAAYGYTDNGNRTIFSSNGIYSTIIYVIRSDATYKYIPENHFLSLFKNGNYLTIGSYDTAPIKFGLVWDKSITAYEKEGMETVFILHTKMMMKLYHRNYLRSRDIF